MTVPLPGGLGRAQHAHQRIAFLPKLRASDFGLENDKLRYLSSNPFIAPHDETDKTDKVQKNPLLGSFSYFGIEARLAL